MTAPPTHFERIILTGFMGSGKTTVGRLLAEHLQWSFVDLDEAVESQLGLQVPEIFAQHGEMAFRKAETEALVGLLAQSQIVVALGGGAATTPAVREIITNAAGTTVVHLHAEFEILEQRCRLQARDPAATVRPLIQDSIAARSRYQERIPFYAGLAHHQLDVSVASPERVVRDILAIWSTLANSRRT